MMFENMFTYVTYLPWRPNFFCSLCLGQGDPAPPEIHPVSPEIRKNRFLHQFSTFQLKIYETKNFQFSSEK